ncbi:uncharacterized protein JCM6883_002959 [Sporobolomyces salmoneus]|uniref:uncharacterized protein n=1 Tax=Sporobolomyces salmoneus TaxID=183962 RepID=UPI00317C6B7F
MPPITRSHVLQLSRTLRDSLSNSKCWQLSDDFYTWMWTQFASNGQDEGKWEKCGRGVEYVKALQVKSTFQYIRGLYLSPLVEIWLSNFDTYEKLRQFNLIGRLGLPMSRIVTLLQENFRLIDTQEKKERVLRILNRIEQSVRRTGAWMNYHDLEEAELEIESLVVCAFHMYS